MKATLPQQPASIGQELISAVNVSKTYGATKALADVAITIYQGEVLALVGENGAGKSTLGKVLAGVISPSSGELRMAGRAIHFSRPRDALRAGFAIVHQELALLSTQSVIRNVFLGIEDHRRGVLSDGALRKRYRLLVQRWGFELDPDVIVGTLSTGDQQKVEILRALARDARMIVMDEPTARLTAPEAVQLHKMVRGLRDQGKSIVLVSHFLEEVLSLSDRVVVMRDGRIVRQGPARDETLTTLVQGMLGRSIEATFPVRPERRSDSAMALEVRALSGEKFRDVDLSVRSGEIVGIAGMVGSGRSELLRAIFGADPIRGGGLFLEGRSVGGFRNPREALAAGISFLPESRKDEGLLLQQSIGDNIVLPHLSGHVAKAGLLDSSKQYNLVRQWIERLQIRCAGPTAGVSSLSGGNQQKVVLAKCLLANPKVLLLDEPTRGVDIGAKRAIYEIIFQYIAKGGAVVMVSSELEEVIGLSDSLLVMRNGRISACLAKEDIAEERVLAAAFGAL
jgi:simple sugar transport system ATP-binding protein/ribose transport system ATP-binding protein